MDGIRPDRTFEQAATRYLLEHQHLRSIVDMGIHLRGLLPYAGKLPLRLVHQGTFEPYIRDRLAAGVRQKTINNALSVARRVLNLSARLWRDDNGLTWLATAPLIQLPPVVEKARPYPLDMDEERRLFGALPGYLSRMALFKVNVGAREQEVCQLRWAWERKVNGLSVFMLPASLTKNGEERLIVCNRVAQSVIEGLRGEHPERVFHRDGKPLPKMYGRAWKLAWATVGLPAGDDITKGVHSLRHTFARRLRAAGVPLETRRVLLGHKSGDLTTHYSAPEIEELQSAVNRLCDSKPGTVLRAVG